MVDVDAELRTPVLDLSTYSGVTLTFKTHFAAYDVTQGDVDVSVNGGVDWTSIWTTTTDYSGTVALDLSALAAGRSDVMLRFHYYNAYYAWWWQVDDVQVSGDTGGVILPAAPSSLTTTLSSQTQITMTWTDNSSNEDGFKIECSEPWARGASRRTRPAAWSNPGHLIPRSL